VRLKNYLEMRGADGGPGRRICAVPALWVGLLYDSAALDGAWEIVKDWTAAEREALRNAVPVTGLKTPIGNRTVADVAGDVVALARGGLARRGNENGEGLDETVFLSSIEEVLAIGMTQADLALRDFEREWHGDIDRIFEAYAY
jgi:glutamate--cysteine ligase